MPLVKTDDRQYARDTQSNALLNTDTTALAKYRAMKAREKHRVQEVSELRTRVDTLTQLVERLLVRE